MNNYDRVDIYNENREKTGKTKIRHIDILKKGEYIIGVQAIIINSNKEILISKRAEQKRDIQDITFEDKEAIDAKWVNIDEYMKMFKNNEIVPNVDFGLKEYKECLRIISNL